MQEEQKEKNAVKPIKKKNYIKRIFKSIIYVIIGLIGLNVILYGLLSIPFIQQKVLNFTISKIKEIVKTEVKIDNVNLTLFNNIKLEGVYIEDQSQDTLIYANRLNVSLSPLKLLENKLLITEIELSDFTANISQKMPDSDFNFQFIINAFSGDTTATDTTKSSLIINIQKITLNNGNLKYNVLSEPITPKEFNASHIQISELNAKLSLPSVDLTSFEGYISALSFKENSGLEVKNLRTKATSSNTTFYLKDTELDLPKSTIKILSAEYNLITSAFKINSDKSVLSPLDFQPFMRNLKNLKEDISLQTTLSGRLPLLKIDSLNINYGAKAHLQGNAYMSDYSNYGSADINLQINGLQIEPSAIEDFAKLGDSTFVTPDIVKTLGKIRLQGSLKGQLNNFNIETEAWANQGALQLIASGAVDTSFTNFSTKAKLQTQNFNLGSLLDISDLGRLSGNIDLVAYQNSKEALNAKVNGKVLDLQYNKQNYRNIPFTAYYNSAKMGAWLKADLPEGKLEAKVDMDQSKNPTIDLDINAQDIQIDKFYPIEEWKNPELTMQAKGNVKGLDLKNIQANIVVSNLEFSHDSLSYKPGLIQLEAGRSDSVKDYISLKSSFLNASITGNYNFMSINDEFSNLMNNYLPGLFNKSKHTKAGKNKFDISISMQDITDIAEILDIPISLIDPITLAGTVNTADNRLNMVIRIPNLKYNDLNITKTKLDLENNDTIINVIGKSNIAIDAGNIKFDVKTKILSDTIDATLAIKRDSAEYNLDVLFEALMHFKLNNKKELVSSLKFKPSKMNIGQLHLLFMPAYIVNEGSRTSISDLGFFVEDKGNNKKFFGINGVVSDQKTDTLNVSFYHSDLEYLFKAFNINSVGAIANGDIKLASVLNTPELYTDNMSLSDIYVFNDTLGDLKIKSQWSQAADGIKFDASLGRKTETKKSTVSGWVYPDKNTLDLKIDLEKFSLNWVQPFMSDMLNRVSGSISTGLTAMGQINSPSISGWLGVNNTYLGIDYTNVTYHISDTINISPDKIGFNNLIIKDPANNEAKVNAEVTHSGFNNLKYKLDANLRNFMVLNTESRTDSLFFGKVFANGSIQINGSEDLIQMNMKLQNSKNSKLTILVPQTSDANVYQNIVYINTPVDETKPIEIPISETSTLPLKLNLNLTVTPDLTLGIIINPLTGDYMQVNGNGLVEFAYDMRSEDMRAIGNYVLTDGYVKIKLQDLLPMQFKIMDGSKLVFNGDPMKTTFDITAYKRVQADLTSLDSSFANDQYSSPRVTVDCLLGIKGNIEKMNITYNISLPEASDDIQQRVKSIIVTDEQKVMQFASLLVAGSFYAQGSNSNLAQGALTSVASSAIGSVLNKALSKVIGEDWNIGTNVSSDDGSFNSMDMTVSVSRKFMNNKLEFNSNLGYRTAQTSNDQFVGDFDVSYALTRSVKLKVFNKTNNTFYNQAPTTQGIGIVYTKEAKTIKQLFRIVRKKRNKNREQHETTTK